MAAKGVVLIGVHTPETRAEHDNEAVAERTRKAELSFPVLIDNERRTWKAWGNRVWPSVYVIDKRGNLRHWWFGELNWRDAGGQTILRDEIVKLLAEETPAVVARSSGAKTKPNSGLESNSGSEPKPEKSVAPQPSDRRQSQASQSPASQEGR